MKAAVVESAGVLKVREVPEPTVGPYDALCDTLYCATCTATDTHIKDGVFFAGMQYPAILGHESIGRVRELGPKVQNYQVGDLVTRSGATAHPEANVFLGWGGFAERGIVRDQLAMEADGVENEGFTFYKMNQVMPPDIDPADETIIINWRETWSYLTRMGVGYGARVLVNGTGGVGLSFVAHAHNLMVGELAVVGSPARFELAQHLGATVCVDYHAEDLGAAIAAQSEAKFDFIIDAVGKRGGLDSLLPALRPGGSMALYGVDEYKEVTVTPTKANGTFTISSAGYAEWEVTEPILRMMREGRLNAGDFYDRNRIFELADINAAFEAVKQREMVKAVVRCSA